MKNSLHKIILAIILLAILSLFCSMGILKTALTTLQQNSISSEIIFFLIFLPFLSSIISFGKHFIGITSLDLYLNIAILMNINYQGIEYTFGFLFGFLFLFFLLRKGLKKYHLHISCK